MREILKRNLNRVLEGTVGGRYGHYHRLFRRLITAVVIVDIIAAILSTFSHFNYYGGILGFVTYLSAGIFSVEYALRIYSAPMNYPLLSVGRSRIKYLFSFFGLVDLLTILPFILPDLLRLSDNYTVIMETTRLLLVLKIARYSKPLSFMFEVLKSVRKEMFFGFSASLIVLLFSGMLIYYVEKDAQPEAFYDIGQGLWWAVVTFATVGYGDIYPVTMLGKLVASLLAMFGIGMIALPTGIISYAFLNKMNELRSKASKDKGAPLPTKGECPRIIRYCPYCGGDNGEINDNKPYCTYCGKNIKNKIKI